MTDHALLLRDKHLMVDPRHPVDPLTGAKVCTMWTHGFENALTMLRMRDPLAGKALENRLKSLSFEGVEEDYGERVIDDKIFAAWGFVKESRRKTYYYVVFANVVEREFIRWKVFGKLTNA